jgi:FkbM family methyltransferase
MKVFLDLGAHLGQTLKIALENKYGFDKVYCFEPVAECCRALRAFNDKRVVVAEFGLWNKTSSQTIYNPQTRGASIFRDKFGDQVTSRKIKLVRASDWFKQNLKTADQIWLKLNCEGAEVAILNDLIKSGEYKKIDVLMVDFDVRKIPSQKHLMPKMKIKLNKLDIPQIFYIDEYHLGRGTHSYFTHYWLNESMKPFKIINLKQTRNDLIRLFKGIGVEVGVEQGDFSELICRREKVKKLYSIDAWKAYKGYRDHTSQKKLDRFYEISQKKLEPYSKCFIMRQFSLEAVKNFMDEFLDFVYLDANHGYQYVYQDLSAWSKKVKKGGIVSGHDYIKRKGQDQYYAVIPAVNDFVRKNKIKELVIYRGDSPASWMFVKP